MGFFSDWCRNRRLERRAVFSYHDGQRKRYADPYVIYRRLTSDPEIDLVSVAAGYDAGDAEDTDAVVALTRKVFDLPPLDETNGEGLTSGEVLSLYFEYNAYLEQQKKSTDTGPISPAPTDSGSSITPEPQVEVKQPSSGSSSTSPASTPEPPTAPSAELPEQFNQPLEVKP